jgi:hypothetical protein
METGGLRELGIGLDGELGTQFQNLKPNASSPSRVYKENIQFVKEPQLKYSCS